MDNNSFFLTEPTLTKIKTQNIKKTLGSLKNNLYPYLYLDKNFRNKSLIKPKKFKSQAITRKNSLSNSKNMSNSLPMKSSISKINRLHFNSENYISTSKKIKKKFKKKDLMDNPNNFNIDKIEIKTQEDWELPSTLSTKLSKSINNNKLNQKKEKGKIFKTKINQKLMFNNVGIHYHKVKNNNKIDSDKNELNNSQEINKLKNQIIVLLKKNENLENEKSEKDNKIKILEEKIDKLLNYMKEKKLGEDNEKSILKDKINSLEKNANYLKNENNELKKEIEKKNSIILALTNEQIENNIYNKKNKSIGRKKEKNNSKNKYANNKTKKLNILDEVDINRIKKISIDPDNF